jgi:fatty acid desaturase
MSTTVRILAAAFGAALFAVLYYGLGIAWYIAILVGIAVFWLFPICQEKLANRQSGRRLRAIIKRRMDSEK